MTGLVSRSTFAYAAILFAILFAPLVGTDHTTPGGHTISLFPSPLVLAAFVLAIAACVRQSLQNRPADESRVVRGVSFASVVSAIAAVLYGIAVAGLGPTIYTTPGFAWRVALGSVVVVWLVGTLVALGFAFAFARFGTPARAVGGAR